MSFNTVEVEISEFFLFCNGMTRVSVHLWHEAASAANQLAAFKKQSGSLETSVSKYPVTQRHIP
jgi:hypothetical protein